MANMTPYEVQHGVAELLVKRWWIFLLGSPAHYPPVVDQIVLRYYPQDDAQPGADGVRRTKWLQRWTLELADWTLEIIGLDPQYATYAQVMEIYNNGSRVEVEPAGDPKQDDVCIFIPINCAHPQYEHWMRVTDRKFNDFMKGAFPPPPRDSPEPPWGPHVIPSVISNDTKAPEFMGCTPWVKMPEGSVIRSTCWRVWSHDEIAVATTQETWREGKISGHLIGKGPFIIDCAEHRTSQDAKVASYLGEVLEGLISHGGCKHEQQ